VGNRLVSCELGNDYSCIRCELGHLYVPDCMSVFYQDISSGQSLRLGRSVSFTSLNRMPGLIPTCKYVLPRRLVVLLVMGFFFFVCIISTINAFGTRECFQRSVLTIQLQWTRSREKPSNPEYGRYGHRIWRRKCTTCEDSFRSIASSPW
jgi:hypothetical protein